jgi:hypothetical protein
MTTPTVRCGGDEPKGFADAEMEYRLPYPEGTIFAGSPAFVFTASMVREAP